jgi:peptidoglycan/xylan/chitin deacetylase (PgdA/CDA1 family)
MNLAYILRKNKIKIFFIVFTMLMVWLFVFLTMGNTLPEQPPTPPAYIRQANLLILMYHDFSPEPPEDAELMKLVTTADKLSADIDVLLEMGYQPISLEDYFYGLAEQGQKYFVITFDDGYKGVYDIAFPLLMERQIPAAVFFNTGMEHYQAFLHYWLLQELEQSGLFKIYTHLAYHVNAAELPIEDYTRYLDASIDFLNTYVGEKPMFLAYPYGKYNRKTYRVAHERGIELQLAQEMLFPATDILLRVNVPYDADMKELVKKAPHN